MLRINGIIFQKKKTENLIYWISTLIKSYSNLDNVDWCKDRKIDQWNRNETPEADSHIYGLLSMAEV